jgi:hypothetical protein
MEESPPISVFKSVEYLDKPFKAEELMAVVKKIFQHPA